MLTNRRTNVKRLVRMHSNEIRDVPFASGGDIVALAGVDCESGVTFTDGKERVVCTSMFIPDPVMSLSVSADRAEQPRFQKGLKRFLREDPTFHLEVRQATDETVISGMGELHLEIYCERLRREYNVTTLQTGAPEVNYRETITVRADYDYTHKRQTGGRGQYAKIVGYIEPMPDDDWEGEGIDFESHLSGNEIPPNFVPSIERGFRAAAVKGQLAGQPLVGLRAVVEDGQAHDVDSSDMAFQAAAAGALAQVYEDAMPVILEPLMKVEVTFPSEFQAAALQTLNTREGSIQATRPVSGDTSMVEAEVPLRTMFGYASDLRSVTQGMGEFSMEYLKYEQMPTNRKEELVIKHREQKESRWKR